MKTREVCVCRDRDQEGPIQLEVNVEPGTAYTFQGYVKLLSNAPGRLWQPVLVVLQLNITGGCKCCLSVQQPVLQSVLVTLQPSITWEV